MNANFLFKIICVIALFLECSAAVAVVDQTIRPGITVTLKDISIEINGSLRKIPASDEIVVVAGDKLVFKEASFLEQSVKTDSINVIGFVPPTKVPDDQQHKIVDDRNFTIKTDQELFKGSSEEKKGEVYSVKINARGKMRAEMKLRVLQPELKYVAIEVNGARQVLRPGGLAKFKGSDKFNVTEIATNVEDDDKEIQYQVIPAKGFIPGQPQIKFFEIQFMRNGRLFASIPLQIEGAEIK